MILLILIALFTQIDAKQKELDQLKEKLTSVRTEIKQLEKEKVGTLAHIEKIDEGITLTIKYIDELTSQMSKEQQNVQQLTRSIAQLEAKMKHRRDDLRERLVRLYKWTPFYKLEIVFSSKSLPQILSSSYYLQILAKDDQQAFFEFKSDWERYLVDKKMREDLIALLDDRRHEKESELDRLSDERQHKKQILDKVAQQASEKINVEKELKSSQRKLEELIVELRKKQEKISGEYMEKHKGMLPWPCKGTVETKFGKVVHPKYNTTTKNNGVDIRSAYGENIYSVAPGNIVYADRFMGYGNMVLIDHHDGFYSLYGHLSEILVETGIHVDKGRIIGRVGESGSLSGPMLHFELRKDGTPVDPLAYLK
ncbi:peptidoglycan DD-metalloendopeptidase family protein [candidate division WOR-3 bacterium]|nr:peptidoglycan DD-metalloendopeptidase family protein [candidate division WOR-3 bacterium]